MLNLFISVIPSEGTITLWAGYRINIKLILYVVNNLLQKCSSNLYLSRYNSHCCQCLNPAYILTSFLYVFSVADPLITHALGISYYSGLDFSCIAVTLARGSWLSVLNCSPMYSHMILFLSLSLLLLHLFAFLQLLPLKLVFLAPFVPISAKWSELWEWGVSHSYGFRHVKPGTHMTLLPCGIWHLTRVPWYLPLLPLL